MTTTYEQVNDKLKNESSFAFAEICVDFRNQPNFLPAPFGVYVWALTAAIHFLNFIPALLWPDSILNVYNNLDHHHFQGLMDCRQTREGCRQCGDMTREKCGVFTKTLRENVGELIMLRTSEGVAEQQAREQEENGKDGGKKVYGGHRLHSSERVREYYISTLLPNALKSKYWMLFAKRVLPDVIQWEKRLRREQFKLHHEGCYAYIAKDGDEPADGDDSVLTLSEIAEKYEETNKFSLDPQDVALIKPLTADTLFCQHCFRPFESMNKSNLNNKLLTPFWTLSEILSIYASYIFLIPLFVLFRVLSLLESVQKLLEN